MSYDVFKLIDYGIVTTILLVGGVAVAVFFARAIRLALQEDHSSVNPLWRIAMMRAVLAIFILSLLVYPVPFFLISADFVTSGRWFLVLPRGVLGIVVGIMVFGGILQVLAIIGMCHITGQSLGKKTWYSFPILRRLSARGRAFRFWLNRYPPVIRLRSLVKMYDRQLW